ncbi:MAG: DUF3320 domain-containing protein [Bradyrhizobium sp.]|nr:DUF3320 domain-containing protein [Bradyrhizobium sp.]
MTAHNENSDLAGDDVAPAVTIEADIAHCFTYASYQNAVPVIRSISLAGSAGANFEGCTLELTSAPPFLRPKTWTIDRIIAGDLIRLSDRKVDLDASYLAGLNEAERGEITLRFISKGAVVAEQRRSVRLLARDEWGGVADMAQLLPAFVMPNDPAIASILRSAADRLSAHGQPSGLDGYQSADPKRAFFIAAAIYSAIAGMSLYYAEPPASFESRGQKVRRPTTIDAERLVTCLDSSLLFASALEAAGLHPVILMFQGHAAVGVWLAPRTFANTIESDLMEVRKALASRELIGIEATSIAQRPPMTFEGARRAVEHRFSEDQTANFIAAIDVRRSRSTGIMPLASHEPIRRAATSEIVNADGGVPLPGAPPAIELPIEIAEVKPTTAAGRIDRWQRKLLDLTLRNRLLSFPDSKKTIPFLCGDLGYLEDRLASGASIRIISLPEQNPLGERDPTIYREVHGRDLNRGFAAEALLRDELSSTLDARQLEARLVELYRQVRNDFAEGGTNTLFLAVGFLRWKKKPEDLKAYRAPLLLVPVTLVRRSASSQFTLQFHEDEPRFNATLLQFLERDFDLRLPQFSGLLPMDDAGVDVPRLLVMMRQAVRDVAGMEVVDETALSTFSFAKFLMWKDLVERTEALRGNRVVRHLIDSPEQAFQSDSQENAFRDERDLDQHYRPEDIVCLLPSDSSQTAASLAAAEGRDFVIVGPPGTGKSQTITNMIANCLAAGKTVLFVAEKTAALDVVYRRLCEHGLRHQCLELHSNKADRRRFFAQLRGSWESTCDADNSEWITINERLKIRRDELNAYVEALHRRYNNGWTPYRAMGIALKSRHKGAPELSWPSLDAHDQNSFSELDRLASDLGLTFQSVQMRPALDMVDVSEWTSSWQDRLLAGTHTLRGAAETLGNAIGAFLVSVGLPPKQDASQAEIDSLCFFAATLVESAGHDIMIAFDRDFDKLRPSLASLKQTIQTGFDAKERLHAAYDISNLGGLDLDSAEQQWKRATNAYWPNSMLGRQKVKKWLQALVTNGQPDPDNDLQLLRVIRDCQAAIAGNLLATKSIPFDGFDTNIAYLENILKLSDKMRAAIRLPNRDREEMRIVLHAILPLLRGDIDSNQIRACAERLVAAKDSFVSEQEEFAKLAGKSPVAPEGDRPIAVLLNALDELRGARHLLRDWSTWCRIRRRTIQLGLGSVVTAIEKGVLAPGDAQEAFRLAYARWWLPNVIDNDSALRDFHRFQHENAISDFREIDDLVRACAARRVTRAIAHGLPSVQSVPRNSELGLLRHQMELQRPSRSIREMISALPNAFPKLAPCMLMSPISIAQYLPPGQALFDVVIFDEASQITTWDAVGAIARGRQTIIVGDPKQLPPTNFFGRNDEDDDAIEYEKDLESILDEAKAAGIPVRDLRWHYRSRSESLIAFSNHYYYQNRLITFPSPLVDDRAVHLRKLPDGVYDRGKSRTNRIEAEAVAAEAVARMNAWLKLGEKVRPTLGIITFNAQQQSLILDLLDQARRAQPELEWFFAEEQRIEPTIVKNLENVQGDERDVILFSITFSKDHANKRLMDFGALNREGGERRLNVAITRARQELIVFSGFTAQQIDPGRTKSTGVQHLKAFLDYAERGAAALPAQSEGSVGAFDSPFEEAVASELERKGWMIVPQVGISGFRIDIGVRHPDLAGAYLAGVECDGFTYHSSATARDRDKLREEVLRGLGWNILRVWSTDWWFDSDSCAQRLHGELQTILERSREDVSWRSFEGAAAEPAAVETFDPLGQPTEEASPTLIGTELVKASSVSAPTFENESQPVAPPPQHSVEAQTTTVYRITDLSSFRAEPERFHDFDYRATLRAMIQAVIDQEAPVRADVLAQRIARAHGWLRTGGKIRDRIDLHLREVDLTSESSGNFVWKKGSVTELLDYRPPASSLARRAIADIPLAELTAVVLANRDVLDEPDPAIELARLLGVERLAAASRGRLEEAIGRARAHGNGAERTR